jgi:hypothetical protein
MFLAILTLLSALSISAVAIFYSIAGLAAIFAGAAVPIMIMGSVLEIGKLVTASWLYQYWKVSPFFLKFYLTISVVVLMFITSMGIFGFLSKAHVEQTAPSSLIIQKIDQIDDRLVRENSKVTRLTNEIERLNTGTNVRVDTLVDTETEKLDSIYARIDKEIADITVIANQNIATQKERITQATERADRDIKQIQQRMKGAFGKSKFDKEIDKVRKNEVAVANLAQKEIIAIQNKLNEDIAKIKEKYQPSIDAISTNISNLTGQAEETTADIEAKENELEGKLAVAFNSIDKLNEDKFVLQSQIKEIEVEVGPIKYIAEFIYDQEASSDILEKSVRWVIIIIIFVFDPLAVLLLIAANFTLKRKFGKSFEEVIGLDGPSNTNTGVDAPTYWKDRFEDMQSQLDQFNALKENEETKTPDQSFSASYTVTPEANYNEDVTVTFSDDLDITSKEEQLEKFKQREKEEKEALEEYSRKAREEDINNEVEKHLQDVKQELEKSVPTSDGFDPDEVEYDLQTESTVKKETPKGWMWTPDDDPESPMPTIIEDVKINDLSDEEVKKKKTDE